ncbi:cytochrome c oxidase assembly protein [Actinopolyspora erythraea]|uniref:Cytochrome c oxidase assembly protein n=1 Tax=Actinopolyspora erythraea TaxID=414996 RepID=A0A223RNF3_9ACTN|nr:cytochrome c oxidase assembly protein [Actinopolyspora erythraea]ASU77419.1 cytochrome c oxidase assembly protein [Actinopolyspora erythraea]
MSDPAPTSNRAEDGAPPGAPGVGRWGLAGAALAVAVTVALVLGAGSDVYAVLGYPDPGAPTKLGVNLLRLVFDLAGAGCLGGLVFAALFTVPQRGGMISPDGYAALRTAGTAAWLWGAAGLLLSVFDAADSAGQSVTDNLTPGGWLGLLEALDVPKAWLLSASLALVLGIACRSTLRWRTTLVLTALAGLTLLPPVLVGHAATNGGHDFASDGMAFHVVAAALWLGTLFAVIAHARRRGPNPEIVARRYRRLAAACWGVLAISGVISSVVLVPPGRWLGEYGSLVLYKVGLLLLVGLVSVPLRRRITRSAPDRYRGMLRLAGAELALLLVTMGISMGMAHVPPPNLLDRDATASDLLIGYDLPDFPSAWQLATQWRFDLLFGTAAVVLAVLYALGVRRLRAHGQRWPVGRTASWLAGCLALLVATSSGVGSYAPVTFGVHMTAHLLLNMLGPALLVLGTPVNLCLRALPRAGRGEPYGPREWLLGVVDSPVARWLSHPVLASSLLVGSLYALYPTGLFQLVMQEHWAHTIMNVYFLGSGWLWFWSVLGVDRTPRRVPQLARLGVTLGMMPALAFFGVLVLSMSEPIAENYYRTLDLSWSVDLMTAQQAGALIGWLGGEVPMLLVLIVLLRQWHREEGDDDDADYEGMFARLESTRS